ncbi:hypothetical protein [Pseudobacter ginsenosidimutans]|uniref:Collagen triple helix repeat protein n=1 Tax=Pseudobacter ginsenosidimutans TaxID=661488 RepID=A0A4Q7N3Y2_9BACT|nr:hypothetical protein [Pseudobacter ginsenosidimutans]QEC44232.1 hypothetical protein FSB84_22100 [Pseudobacter ginsenosidimutans]RZS75691.1 hypothetical protein EV199_1563 [Pseudobacter ginsenosidimutans]
MSALKQLILLFFFSFFLFSCSKEGPQGPAGENGKNGQDGANGNANVITGAFILDNSKYARDSWSIRNGNATTSYPAKMANVSVASLTQDIFNNGTVLVYMKIPAGSAMLPDSWTPLPHSNPSGNYGYMIMRNYTYRVGLLQLYYYFQYTDNASIGTAPYIGDVVVPTQEFKYVVIAGNAAANSVARPPVDYSNYEAVKTYFRLQE